MHRADFKYWFDGSIGFHLSSFSALSSLIRTKQGCFISAILIGLYLPTSVPSGLWTISFAAYSRVTVLKTMFIACLSDRSIPAKALSRWRYFAFFYICATYSNFYFCARASLFFFKENFMLRFLDKASSILFYSCFIQFSSIWYLIFSFIIKPWYNLGNLDKSNYYSGFSAYGLSILHSFNTFSIISYYFFS